jgi:hypothetical protein
LKINVPYLKVVSFLNRLLYKLINSITPERERLDYLELSNEKYKKTILSKTAYFTGLGKGYFFFEFLSIIGFFERTLIFKNVKKVNWKESNLKEKKEFRKNVI